MHAVFAKQNSKSERAHKASCAHLPGGNTRTVLHSRPFPLTFSSASAQQLVDLDGHRYIDFLGEYTAGIYGHSDPIIQKAVQDAMATGWNLGGHSEYEKKLAKIVCERFSPTVELVRFTNSGTEANMLALATAKVWTRGRKNVLVFEGGYHGSTISFGGSKGHINLPYEWVVGTYNDVAATETLIASLPKQSLAAILVEPMLGSGGAIPSTPEFLHYLRRAATESAALLILDEIMTSRLAYHGLGEKMGVRADLMTLGKWIGGGMSFGAFGGRRDIMDLYDPARAQLAHAGTFNNNVISMAAGIAGCGILSQERLDELNKEGEWMQQTAKEQLMANGIGHPPRDAADGEENDHGKSCMWVSGIGSIMAIHFAGADKEALQELFFHYMLSVGIYLAPRGFIALSIEITHQDIEVFLRAIEQFVEKYLVKWAAWMKKRSLEDEASETDTAPETGIEMTSGRLGRESGHTEPARNMRNVEEGKLIEQGKATEQKPQDKIEKEVDECEESKAISMTIEHEEHEEDGNFVLVERSQGGR